MRGEHLRMDMRRAVEGAGADAGAAVLAIDEILHCNVLPAAAVAREGAERSRAAGLIGHKQLARCGNNPALPDERRAMERSRLENQRAPVC